MVPGSSFKKTSNKNYLHPSTGVPLCENGSKCEFVAGISTAAIVGSLVIMLIVGISQGWFSSNTTTITPSNTNDAATKKNDSGPQLNLGSIVNEDKNKKVQNVGAGK